MKKLATSKAKPQTLKGFRDLLPEEAKLKQRVIETLREVFESFGFQPLETPTLEYASTLLGKYGEEADKLIYTFKDKGGREVGLRYDLTVPVCKVLSLYQSKITFPFKRYQIQNLFRAEKPQRGRFREFTQCDVDIFGVKSPLADGEIILVIYTALKKVGLKEFTININSRQVLFALLEKAGIKEKGLRLSVLQSIDKLGKKPKEEVEKELEDKKISPEQIRKIFNALNKAKPDEELKQIFSFLKSSKVPEEYYQFNPSMVRGLDYYTRAIFETYVTKPKIGSVTGGGRYDNLVAQLGGPDISGTGTSIGLERIVEVIKEFKLWPDFKSPTKVLVTIFSPELQEKSIKIANQLREASIPTELYLDPQAKLDKQLKYADRKKIPFAIIIGPDEVEKEVVVLKNLQSRSQKTIILEELFSAVS
jgi:histidyl-tRNA synthetase